MESPVLGGHTLTQKGKRLRSRSWLALVIVVPLVATTVSACGVATTDADIQLRAPSASPPASEVASPEPTSSSVAAMLTPAPSTTPAPSPTAAPSSAPTDSNNSAPGAAGSGPETAQSVALALSVKGRSAKTGYARDEFGSGWVDVDRNGCDTRNDMLILRLENRDMSGPCKVLSGDLPDPYTGTWIHFERGGKSEVDIDHIVALSDAWQKGASGWEFAKRVALANDPLNLEPVQASANRQKGAGDAATWLPSYKPFRCDYVARQVAVKEKYDLWVTQAELDAMTRVLSACPDQSLPAAGSQPVIAENIGKAPAPQKTSTPKKETKKPNAQKADPADTLDKRYAFCNKLPSGLGPYFKGEDPEYDWYTDRDKDGVVCE